MPGAAVIAENTGWEQAAVDVQYAGVIRATALESLPRKHQLNVGRASHFRTKISQVVYEKP